MIFKNKSPLLIQYEIFRSLIPYKTESIYIDTSYGRTHVLVSGPIESPPIIMLHGMKTSSAQAMRELQHLLPKYRLFAIDMIGESVMSDDTLVSYQTKDYAHWLEEVRLKLELQNLNILGISLGGFVASLYTLVYPTHVKKLSLLVPAGYVHGPLVAGLTKFAWPFLVYKLKSNDRNFARFLETLLTTKEEIWVRYLRVAFDCYKFNL
jgi:2-hydroxy-6-oxonona-2,4-dienedioate hydrolase